MKKIIISLSLLFSSVCFAIDPYTVLIVQEDPTGSFQQTKFLPRPDADSYLKYDRSIDFMSWDAITNMAMTSSQMTDSTSVGRSVMTATDKAAARTAIGAGTSNFDGDYNSLTNRITNNNQLTNGAGFITSASAPVTSVNTKTGAVTLTNTDVGAAATSHTHTASQISDSTTIGRQLLTATNQASVQSIVGVSVPSSPSQSAQSRTLNSAFQVSSSRNSLVYYSVKCTITASIAGGQDCDVILEIAADSGFTTSVQTLSIIGTGQTYTLAVAIQGVQPQTGVLSGFVPSGYYVRLRTVNNTGSPTYLYRSGQEVLL